MPAACGLVAVRVDALFVDCAGLDGVEDGTDIVGIEFAVEFEEAEALLASFSAQVIAFGAPAPLVLVLGVDTAPDCAGPPAPPLAAMVL